MNILADVTAGTSWGLEEVDRQNGESVVIARTDIGSSLVAKSSDKGTLKLRGVDYQDVLRGRETDNQEVEWRTYCELWRAKGLNLPGFTKLSYSR